MHTNLFQMEVYPFMYRGEVIGTFTIEKNKSGKYVYTLDLISYVPKTKIPWVFLDFNEEFISKNRDLKHHKAVLSNWVEERVFPEERHASEELLSKIGLCEYDQLAILKYTRASSRYDYFWIKFEPTDTYTQTIKKKWITNK